jgi:hypothetical protein
MLTPRLTTARMENPPRHTYFTNYAGAPVSWSSRKQDIVATGSTVAEYIALDGAVREALYPRKILL